MLQGIPRLEMIVEVSRRSAIRHLQQPPRMLFTSGYLIASQHRAYALGLREAQRINGDLPALAVVIDPDLSNPSCAEIADDDGTSEVFKRAAYPIPAGKTYLVTHFENGMFRIIDEDCAPSGGGV